MSDVIGGSIHGDGPSVIGGSIGGRHDDDGLTTTPGTVRSYAQTIGDGVTTVFAITHNLGTLDTHQQAYNPLTGLSIAPTAYTTVHTNPNVDIFTFTAAPAVGAARVVIEG